MSRELDLRELPLAMFPSGHGWTGNGKGSFSDAGAPLIVNNDRSFKIETNGKGEASIASSPELAVVDLTGCHVAFQSQISFSNRLGLVKLRLASGNISTDFAEAVIWDDSEDSIILGSSFEMQTIPTGEFAVTGSVNWAAIKRAQIILTDNATGAVTLYVAGIYAVPTPKQAIVTFAFDDGSDSVVSRALPKLSAYRYPASFYVIADIVGDEGIVDLEDLYTLRNLHHWEIGGHAFTLAAHNLPDGWDSLEGKELEDEVDGLRGWLDEHGFRRATMAYPKGAAGQEVRALVKRDYGAGRATAMGPETLPARDDYTLRGSSIDGTVQTAASINSAIDKAVAAGAWLILTFHEIVTGAPEAATEYKQSAFGEIVDHVRALQVEGKDIEVLTMAEAIEAISGNPPTAGAGGSTSWYETKIYTVPDEIKVPAGATDFLPPFIISLREGQTAKVVKVLHEIGSGTSATLKIQKNGVDLTGFTGIEVKAEKKTTDPADQAIADGDVIAPVVTAVSGTPKNLSFAIVLEHTVA
ncbi:MAG TPA: polysaccharide deacetylase family protein [Solirubrobacterales bacterium]|nr:polysaccharide deacetylase family protein [Solirubrobacterales bacterium]